MGCAALTEYAARPRNREGLYVDLAYLGAYRMTLQPYFNIADRPIGFGTERSLVAQRSASKTNYRVDAYARSTSKCSEVSMLSNCWYVTELIHSQCDGGVSGARGVASTGLLPLVKPRSFDFRVRFTRDWLGSMRRQFAACSHSIFKMY
jgi:hypothetical protein